MIIYIYIILYYIILYYIILYYIILYYIILYYIILYYIKFYYIIFIDAFLWFASPFFPFQQFCMLNNLSLLLVCCASFVVNSYLQRKPTFPRCTECMAYLPTFKPNVGKYSSPIQCIWEHGNNHQPSFMRI